MITGQHDVNNQFPHNIMYMIQYLPISPEKKEQMQRHFDVCYLMFWQKFRKFTRNVKLKMTV